MKILPLIFLLWACGAVKATAPDEHKLECDLVLSSVNKTIQRCVNDEVICYVLADSISCISK